MPLSVTCSACGAKLKAKETLAGRLVPCPKCSAKLQIPQPEAEEESYALQDEPEREKLPAPRTLPPQQKKDDSAAEEVAEQAPRRKKLCKEDVAALPPLAAKEPPLWLRHLHWLLVLAMFPLAFSLLHHSATGEDVETRVDETIEQLSEEERERFEHAVEAIRSEKDLLDRILTALPKKRLAGAFLPRDTWAHWIFGLGAALLFMAFFLLLSTHDTAEPVHLLAIGAFTATVGIGFLLIVQMFAAWSQRVWVVGGLWALPFWIVKLIGYSYQAALDPDNGFFLSFVGFTLGVGFCEEVVKAAPLLWYYRQPRNQSWRSAFLWGLASGAGFGIAEGIMYSSSFYNGVFGADIYLVRFISCVALHALWTGSVGITLNQRQALIQQEMDHWYYYLPPVLYIVAVPMVLHGLYDTLLKKEMNAAALGVAILSFLYLAFQISRLHSVDDEEATADMLREYQRRRQALS